MKSRRRAVSKPRSWRSAYLGDLEDPFAVAVSWSLAIRIPQTPGGGGKGGWLRAEELHPGSGANGGKVTCLGTPVKAVAGCGANPSFPVPQPEQ